MRLVPMEFSEADVPARQTDSSDSLHLSPSASAVTPSQTLEISNASTRRDGFDNGDIADDLDIHAEIVPFRAMSL